MKSSNKGFTLIELVIVIAIISVLGTTVFLNIRPGEILSNSRNATRKSDLTNLVNAITTAQSTGNITLVSTNGWKGSTDANVSYVVTGTGYVPFTALTTEAKLGISKLPSDPLNGNAIANVGEVVQKVAGTAIYKVAYCSDGKDFEVEIYLENDTKNEMNNDGGNNPTAYEVGSNVLVCQ